MRPMPEAPPAEESNDHDADDQAMDDELNDMIADELQQALDQKDKKGILEAIRALVLNCKE